MGRVLYLAGLPCPVAIGGCADASPAAPALPPLGANAGLLLFVAATVLSVSKPLGVIDDGLRRATAAS